jgi:hypothetical protein
VTYVCILLVQALSSGHTLTTILPCSHGNQHIYFNSTCCSQEQWLEIQSIRNPGNLISHTQLFNPDKPVSVLSDACAAIDQDRYKGIGYSYGGLTWERAYTANEKCMCRRDNFWPCDHVGSYYCPYWSCISLSPPFTRGQLPQTALLVPVIL